MDIKNAIDDIAKVLEPFATVIYIVGVAGTCVLASWAFLRGRLSTKDAEIRELKTINDHLRDENSKAENSIEELKDEIKRLKKERNGLTKVALDKADQQVRDGKEENANNHLMEWLNLEAPLIAEVCCRLARWRLSAAQDEQHGEAAVPLADAERLITIARALHPENRQLRDLKYEILISKHHQDPAATADDLMRSLADEYDDLDPFILSKYADKYYEAGNYHHALALYERATVILRETAGLNDRETLISQHNLAKVLRALKRLEESEALQRETWEAMKQHLGPNDRDTLISQGNLAIVLRALKRPEESEALHRETWEAMKKYFPPNDRDTLRFQNNLAEALHALKRLEESEALHRETWEARKKHLPPNDRDTLIGQSNLAEVLHDLDRLEESEALQREAWEAMKKHLRPDDPEIFCSQNCLARVLHELKRPEEAEALATATAPPGDDAGESEAQP